MIESFGERNALAIGGTGEYRPEVFNGDSVVGCLFEVFELAVEGTDAIGIVGV